MESTLISGWAAFWLFMAVFYYCDMTVYLRGHEGWFHKHKTAAEFEIQKAIIENLRQGAVQKE